jgi:hypothetical protein
VFSAFLGELKGYFGKAFMLAVWLPVFVCVSAGLVVVLVGHNALGSAWKQWLELKIEGQGVLAVAFLMAITLVAFIIHYLQVPISRLYEGYWDDWPILRRLGQWKRKRYANQLTALDERLDALAEQIPTLEQDEKPAGDLRAELNRLSARRLLYFPPPGDAAQIMPTRLGNIYKVAELYPYRRYGIDAVIVWPRLREVLPENFVGRLQEMKIAVDFLLLFGLLTMGFAIITVLYLLTRSADWSLIIVCALGLPLGCLSYRAALASAQTYAELIKVAFDLYRHPLLKSLGLPFPPTLSAEQKLWRDLSTFIFRGILPAEEWRYDSPPAKPREPILG